MKPGDDRDRTAGRRCHICTGCGRCGIAGLAEPIGGGSAIRAENSEKKENGGRGLRVLTADGLYAEGVPFAGALRERLVTADIGTTTIALQLYRRDGTVAADHVCVNPQVKYGADVLSRIQAAEDAAAREEMRSAVFGVLEVALDGFAAYLEQGEHMRMVLAGNTTMIYLLRGYDPAELGRAPFHASRLQAEEMEIGGVPCSIFPGQSAFVGGDITAGIFACGMCETEELTLLIDLGTNGEMVLGNRERMIACATAAGPAFEGGVNRGVWGADMVGILARLRKEGVMDETGLLADAYFESGVRIHDVCVTQSSIRAVQLAKAAIAAGIRVLAREYGIKEPGAIRRVVLAGGFGYYLDPREAAVIGLLPGELAERAIAGGNTALSGALRIGRRILQAEGLEGEAGKAFRRELFAEMEPGGSWRLEILNLAEQPDFEEWYIEAMNF